MHRCQCLPQRTCNPSTPQASQPLLSLMLWWLHFGLSNRPPAGTDSRPHSQQGLPEEPGPSPLQTRPRATAACITASSIFLASSNVSQDDMLKTNTKPCAYLTWYSNVRALRCQDGGASISWTPVIPAGCFARTLRFVEGSEGTLPSVRLVGPEANRVASRILSRPV